MEIKGKRLLSVITYYTLVGLALAMAVAFILALSFRTYPGWAKVVYFAWGGVVIGTVIFDIICTSRNKMKYVAGIMVYVLSVLAVVMSVLLYMINTTRMGLGIDLRPVFTLVTALSYLTTVLMIAEYLVGESLIEHNTSAKALKSRGVKQ